MLQRNLIDWQKLSWQEQLHSVIRDPRELLAMLDLPHNSLPAHLSPRFKVRVPHAFVARMGKADPNDPLLLQVWPGFEEDRAVPGYKSDPVGDLAAMKVPGLLHKYHGRVLLIASPSCAVHCRYCFRRDFPYTGSRRSDRDAALNYITEDPSINEVILSGGDPLTLHDEELKNIVTRITAIPHVRRLRIHTRLPIMIPARFRSPFWQWLGALNTKPVVVVHINHANEIDGEVISACRQVRAAGVMLLNQSVLLRGVNDNVDALAALSERLFEAGILPYYLHILDKVAGAAHFDVPVEKAQILARRLQGMLSGFLVPRLVLERAGAAHKIPM